MDQPKFDEILERKVRFGRYQYFLYFVMAFVCFTDGAEMVALSVLIPVFQLEFNLSET